MNWSAPPVGHRYTLMPTPETTVWGYYDPGAKPALHVASGDEVEVGTVLTNSPTNLMRNGLDSKQVEPFLTELYAHRPQRTGGGHILTGPIYMDGADSGDVIEVRFKEIKLAIPYAYNSFGGRSGYLPEDFQGMNRTKIIPLDSERMVAHFAPGIDIPLHPFFGSVGLAPAAAVGPISSAPPGKHAGNLDNKELVAGTALFVGVQTKGGLLEIGDGHAGQGNGEVDITALETSLRARIQLVLHKDMHLTFPRAETPTHWIAMGIDSNLVTATKTAIRQAIDFLMTQKGLSHEDAYMLVSTACDVDITELVDGTLGVHVMIPKNIFLPK
ncbi:MAG TPA: acetamidase/formamidase family protein [Gemmatimonadaceae bacterium]|nr:acetamidase/formamidase family protein [Gemmatimonadaceae bacterium]